MKNGLHMTDTQILRSDESATLFSSKVLIHCEPVLKMLSNLSWTKVLLLKGEQS